MSIEAKLTSITTMSNQSLLRFLFEHNLLQENVFCTSCLEPMCLKSCSDGWVGHEWRCVNYGCDSYLNSISIRRNSFFENIATPVKTVLKVFCYWAEGLNQTEILRFVEISRPTLSKIRKTIIMKISQYFIQNPIRLGGPGSIIQCDEVMLNHKVKSHRGRSPKEKVWALVIVDCSTSPSKGFVKIVSNRSKNALIPIICSVVRPGSTIHTDEWPSYFELCKRNDYEHSYVTHKYNFVCPNTGVHTQQVESFNNKLMLKIKEMKGLNDVGRSLFIDEFCFLDWFKNSAYEKLIEIIKI